MNEHVNPVMRGILDGIAPKERTEGPIVERIPSHIAGEYARLGISVKDNFGLSSAVLVNVLTGVMHVCTDDGACLCDKDGLWRTEAYGVLRSVSSVNFRACRLCEGIVRRNWSKV